MPTYLEVHHELRRMGRTADELAAFLRAQAIVGRRFSRRHNPLVRYLNLCFLGADFRVASHRAYLEWGSDGVLQRVTIPPAVTELLWGFDDLGLHRFLRETWYRRSWLRLRAYLLTWRGRPPSASKSAS